MNCVTTIRKLSTKLIFLVVAVIFMSDYGYSQDYQLELRQRRSYDRIDVEIWAKSITDTPKELGYASLVLEYNSVYLKPSVVQTLGVTDSIHVDIDQANPIVSINSEFNGKNGYQTLKSGSYSATTYSLELTLSNPGQGGIVPLSEGMGSFLGLLSFDIINSPGVNDTTGLRWNKTMPGDTRIFANDSTDIEADINFIAPETFTVLGITILSPNLYGQVIDRDKDYASLIDDYVAGGYPIYFERSVDPVLYPADSEDMAYLFEYSLDDGNNWGEIGRAAAATLANIFNDEANYRTGEIFNPNTASSYVITTQTGTRLTNETIREPLRTLWTKDLYYILRSEQARIRVTQLNGTGQQELNSRSRSAYVDMSDNKLVLGRLFFVQIDGQGQYLKTTDNFSNPTQLTVEAWINLNEYNATGENPGVVVSSGGPNATPVMGSKEGSWMLYLRDGKQPAFRVRELEGRGENGYIASLLSWDTLTVRSDVEPLDEGHATNWVHLAATVEDNKVCLYVNSELVDSYTNNEATNIRMLTSNHPIWVGVNPNATTPEYLHAGIKGVRVWRTALTADQIRQRVAGVDRPDEIDTYNDIKKGLELYYGFEGSIRDLGSNVEYQKGAQTIDFYNTGVKNNNIVKIRPDRPHVTITSPATGAGVKNKEGDIFDIRWVSYGLGDIANKLTKDVVLEYSLDNGENWSYVENATGIKYDTLANVDVETGIAQWEPYENSNTGANLRSITPYAKPCWLRIRGTENNTQEGLNHIAKGFNVAPYFSMRKDSNCLIEIPGDQGMNIVNPQVYMETWMRPYSLPTDSATFMPLISKIDTSSYQAGKGFDYHYDLRVNRYGQLVFSLTDDNGNIRTATSDIKKPVIRPNSIQLDTAWTHVGVFLDTKSGVGQSEILFYVDGTPQTADSIKFQLGEDLKIQPFNNYKTYIGYYPGNDTTYSWTEQVFDSITGEPILDDLGNPIYDTLYRTERIAHKEFVGELREMRFWNGVPNNTARTGNEPTEMTRFIQGALTVSGAELDATKNNNLYAVFSMDEGAFISNGFNRALGSSINSAVTARVWKEMYVYKPVRPYVKLVEPIFQQIVPSTDTNLRVRWVGFEYNGVDFFSGDQTHTPSLEFSCGGGGGNEVQPYQYVGSRFWPGNEDNSLLLPTTNLYLFSTGTSNIYYASRLNVSIADPDENDDENTSDQGPLAASLTNARLRLTGLYTINGTQNVTLSEGPLFTITPASNFTVRVLLEGYHRGYSQTNLLQDLGHTYDEGGLKISLYKNNSGGIGEYQGSAESIYGYDDRDPKNRDANNNRFANVNFVYTDLNNGNYWVLVEHLNHLPIMSRLAAPFQYIGDDRTTWTVESGWDFQTWNGVDNNVITDVNFDPWDGQLYTARGNAVSTELNPLSRNTGLIYNDGVSGTIRTPMASMVGGDCVKDGVINAADRVRVRYDEGTSLQRSDITGDGVVNADDRTIVDRNYTRSSSIQFDIDGVPNSIRIPANQYISSLDESLSQSMVDNYAKLEMGDYPKPEIESKRAAKKNVKLQSALSYQVSGDVYTTNNEINIKVYIVGTGSEFNLANCTFAIKYNTDAVKFVDLLKEEPIIYDAENDINGSANEYGYWGVNYAPKIDPETGMLPDNVLKGVHSIELSFDATQVQDGTKKNQFPGLPLTKTRTYLGTMRFALLDSKGAPNFEWYKSSSVHAVNEGIVTQYGEWVPFENIRMYDFVLTAPNGGEVYSENSKYNVTWQTDGNDYVNIELSTSSGNTWSKLNVEPIQISAGKYTWTTPSVSSESCLIRVVTVSEKEELDRSDNLFAIMADFAQITKPTASATALKGGANDYITWKSAGYDKVRFDFTSDLGQNWTTIVPEIDADLASVAWTIPMVTTKAARIRMIDLATGEEIAISGVFKILIGEVFFKNPAVNERIDNKISKTGGYLLRWNSQNVEEFDLQLSTDAGSTWWYCSQADKDVDATARKHVWNPATLISKQCVLRAIFDEDESMVYGVSNMFELYSTSYVEELPDGCTISEAYPNPAEKSTNIKLFLVNRELISIDIYDESGKKVKTIDPTEHAKGEQLITINTSDLPSGRYFIYISSDNIGAVRNINIIR